MWVGVSQCTHAVGEWGGIFKRLLHLVPPFPLERPDAPLPPPFYYSTSLLTGCTVQLTRGEERFFAIYTPFFGLKHKKGRFYPSF